MCKRLHQCNRRSLTWCGGAVTSTRRFSHRTSTPGREIPTLARSHGTKEGQSSGVRACDIKRGSPSKPLVEALENLLGTFLPIADGIDGIVYVRARSNARHAFCFRRGVRLQMELFQRAQRVNRRQVRCGQFLVAFGATEVFAIRRAYHWAQAAAMAPR